MSETELLEVFAEHWPVVEAFPEGPFYVSCRVSCHGEVIANDVGVAEGLDIARAHLAHQLWKELG